MARDIDIKTLFGSRVICWNVTRSNWALRLNKSWDAGPYMCQLNTDPMKSRMGTLQVIPHQTLDDRALCNSTSQIEIMMHPAGDNSARYRGNHWAKGRHWGGTCQVRIWMRTRLSIQILNSRFKMSVRFCTWPLSQVELWGPRGASPERILDEGGSR